MTDESKKRHTGMSFAGEALSIPNILSYFRLLLIPVFVILYAQERFAAALRAQLQSEFYRAEQADLLGPAPAQVARVNYHYRCRLTLSCRNTRTLRQLVAHLVREFAKKTRDVGLYADINGVE